MPRRSGKFYVKNEKDVMKLLGLTPTKASGAGWIEKEDGYNDNVLCQLKSTDNTSISVKLLDIQKLEYHANVENKIPVFAIQFLKELNDDIDLGTYLLIKPSDLCQVVNYINNPSKPISNNIKINQSKPRASKEVKKISSSLKAKENFKLELENKYKSKRRK